MACILGELENVLKKQLGNTKNSKEFKDGTTKAKERVAELSTLLNEVGAMKKAMQGQINTETNVSNYDKSLADKIANKLQKLYSHIEVAYLNGQTEMRSVLEELSGGLTMFQLSNKRKQEFEQKLRKARPELADTKIDEVLKNIEQFSETESNGDEKLMKKLEILALHWTLKGNVILPEDGSKVMQALKIADKNKLDPFSYNSPNEITESFAKVEDKVKPLDPDYYIGKGYSNKQEWAEGVTVYDVANNDIGREVSRAMIDTHFGKDANPWCLLARKNGSIDATTTYWYSTYPGNKKIAFKDGKLVAFYGGDKWWDRMDNPSNGVEILKRVQNYNNTAYTAVFSTTITENEVSSQYLNKLILGNTKNGEYKEYAVNSNKPDNLIMEVAYIDGLKEGLQTEYGGWDNKIYKTTAYKNGLKEGIETVYNLDTGNKMSESMYSNNMLNGPTKIYSKNTGDLFSTQVFKDDKKDGVYAEYEKGRARITTQYANGSRNGPHIEYYSNGNIEKKVTYKDDKPTGTTEIYYRDGSISKSLPHVDGEINGVVTGYATNGTVIQKETYSKGIILRRTTYNADGTVKEDKSFNKVHTQKSKDVVKGAAVLSKNKILVDIENRSTDTLAHEYAHFYIAGFRNTPIVQEAIKKWGSEEALVQAIGEETVAKKGNAYGFWKRFSKWLKDLVANLDKASKEDLVKALTDAFLTNVDLNTDAKKTTSVDGGLVNNKGFNGYVPIKDTGGKGSVEGDAKDIAMREVADGFVGEISNGRLNNSSTGTSYNALKDNVSGPTSAGSITYHGAAEPSTVMLARNGSFRGKPLNSETKEAIEYYFQEGASFVVGDMPGVDSQFINYLDEIGASYKIYHTGNNPRIVKEDIKYQKGIKDSYKQEADIIVPSEIFIKNINRKIECKE